LRRLKGGAHFERVESKQEFEIVGCDGRRSVFKAWVPELRHVDPIRLSHLPNGALADDYPVPIVDYGSERKETSSGSAALAGLEEIAVFSAGDVVPFGGHS
jgi:deoxyribodipyrimidine photolyase